jgi:hypothetical protein
MPQPDRYNITFPRVIKWIHCADRIVPEKDAPELVWAAHVQSPESRTRRR